MIVIRYSVISCMNIDGNNKYIVREETTNFYYIIVNQEINFGIKTNDYRQIYIPGIVSEDIIIECSE